MSSNQKAALKATASVMAFFVGGVAVIWLMEAHTEEMIYGVMALIGLVLLGGFWVSLYRDYGGKL